MPANREVELCRYHYDPLDRLVGTSPTSDNKHLRFYCKDRLATELKGPVQCSIFQQNEQLLAQQNRQGELVVGTSLLATNQMRSVLQVVKANQPNPITYSPYGHRPAGSGLMSLLGFNGEQPDTFTGHYLLGNGYRAFNQVLMWFNSPDNISPFGKGGLNPYAYCLGDPINRYDETGHIAWLRSLSTRVSKAYRTIKNSLVLPSKGSGGAMDAPEVLENRKLSALSSEIKYNKKYVSNSKHYKVSIVKNIEKLRSKTANTGKVPYPEIGYIYESTNFILSDKGEIALGRAHHSVLASFTKSSKVITAGTIRRGSNSDEWVIHNSSGHYQPPYESLAQIREPLENMGAKIILAKH